MPVRLRERTHLRGLLKDVVEAEGKEQGEQKQANTTTGHQDAPQTQPLTLATSRTSSKITLVSTPEDRSVCRPSRLGEEYQL